VSTYPDTRAVSKAAGYDRVLVDGKDVTFFRGAETTIGTITLTEPFAYGPTTLGFPRIAADLEPLGTGDLSWVREDAPVVIQRVDDPTAATPTVLATDYRGFVVSINPDGRNLTLEVGGEFSGPASMLYKPDILARRVKDLGFWFANIAQQLGLGLADRDGPTTGIEVADAGAGSDLLSWAGDVCAWSQTSSGGQRTMMPTTWGGQVWGFGLKDTTTKHLTLFTDDARVVASLRRDRTQIPTTWYGTGITPDGVRWRNARYPGVFAGPAPTFPGNMTVGDTDATTTTGDGVTVLQHKLAEMGYLAVTQTLDYTTYTSATAYAVKKVQDDADLTQSGNVNAATWDALFDVSVTGYSLTDARVFPILQDPRVRQFNYTSNGSISGLNTAYDASVKPVERFINFGDGVTKAQAVAWCRGEMARLSGKNWSGTITLNGFSGFVGEWAAGSSPTGADIMSQRDIRPGMNAWLPQFDGGTLVHISGVQIDRDSQRVTLTVDTLARDFLELAAINARNKEAQRHIRREWFASNRAAKASGAMVVRDELFGLLDRDVALQGDKWNVIPVVVGQQGQVNRVRIRLVNNKAKFSAAVLSKPMTPDGKPGVSKRLMRRVGNPLTTAAESVWEQESLQDWFDDDVVLWDAGDGNQPCGYSPRRHRDDNGDVTSAPITGRLDDAQSWSYICAAGTHVLVFLAIYPDRDCTLKRGQILYAQLDDAV
jgi:hypothetical protein